MSPSRPGRKAGLRPLVTASLAALLVVAGAGPVIAASTPAWTSQPITSSPTVTLSVVTRPGLSVLDARSHALGGVRSTGVASAEVVGPARPSGNSFQLKVPVASLASTLASLRANSSVVSAEPVHPMSLLDVPDDSLYASDQKTYLSAIDLPKAWDVTHGSADVKVAVIDTGANTSHPDLSGKVVGRYNAVTGSSTVTDNVGHGTMVASMIAANTDNNAGMAGAGWDTDLLIVRVADSQGNINDADVAEGVNWAVSHGAEVINLSLGGAEVGTALKNAIAHAVASNVVVVAAAGNNGTTAKFYPAALPGVLAVGATSPTGGSRASFSEYGSWVDVAAPGEDIIGADSSGSGYDVGDGTSFASPLVAGVAALVRAFRPTLSAAAVVSTLTATASTNKLGFAHGRVDAYKALGYHLSLPGPTVTSPTAGQSEGDTVSVQLTVPADEGVDHVKVGLVGRGPSVTAAVTGNAATVDLPLWGSAGSQTVRVIACKNGLCSTDGTDVHIAVSYAAPILTSPTDGPLTADWTASATSAAPAVRFLADGTTVLATDTSSPFTATIPIGKLSNGPHTITAVTCDAAGTTCDAAPSGAAHVTVSHLLPTITALTPSPFSPNGDGVSDHATLRYTLDAASDVTVDVTSSSGTVVRTGHIGTQAAGAHSWAWNGKKDNGSTAATGTYTVHLLTSAGGLSGAASKAVRLDDTHPSVTSAATTYPSVYPHHDGYRDSTVLSAHLSETSHVTVEVTKSSGAKVWSAKVSRSGSGAVHATWKGTSSAGHALAAGHYRYRFIATDLAGNVTTSASHQIVVSSKKAVSRTWKKTVSAQASSHGQYQSTDDAGYVEFYNAFGTGALRFHASTSGQVRTVNTLALPTAAAYGSVRVDAYARGVSGGSAYLAFINDANNEVSGVTLSSSTRTHKGKSASATAALLDGHSAQWELVVSRGDTYDVRSYTVTLTYLVLV